jgi:hypothetical protein
MSEMLERAARAVAIAADAETAARASVGQEPYIQEKHHVIALAVLMAIWKPTDDMVRAGEAWRDHCGDAASIYEEMIRVAIHGPNC